MAIGLGLVFYELQTNFMRSRLGLSGHILILVCGTASSVMGLKELVARFWPRLAGGGYHFLLPREGGVYLAIMFALFVGSYLGRSNMLMMVFAMMVGPFVMNGWFTFTMLRGLHVRRGLPSRIMAGETFRVSVVLSNRKTWLSAWMMTVHDSVSHSSAELFPEVLFLRVPPASQRQGSYHVCLGRRGTWRFAHLDVTTRFPLGLVQRGIGLDVPQQVLVYPRLGHLHPQWRRLMQHSMELVSHVRPLSGTFQDEMHRIREYRQGDDPRTIHWRTTARMNELMVCEYHESRDRDLTVIVDAWQPGSGGEDREGDLERGLSFAATICMHHLRYSRQSSLVVKLLGKQLLDWQGNAGEHQTDALLDGFALLEPSVSPDLAGLMKLIDFDLPGQRRMLVVTTRPREVRDELARWQNGHAADLQVCGSSSQELQPIFKEG